VEGDHRVDPRDLEIAMLRLAIEEAERVLAAIDAGIIGGAAAAGGRQEQHLPQATAEGGGCTYGGRVWV